MPLQIRRGTEAERLAMAVPLAQGELLYVTNTQRIYVGNGSTLGGIAVTGYTDNDAKDAAASIFTGGSHTGINFSYNTATDVISATVDLSDYNGTINASALKGTIVADDSSILIDGITGKINLDGSVKGNIIPDANEAYDIGSASYRFKDLYLSGTSLYLGNAVISATGTAINLPLGTTLGGVPISQDGVVTGSNYNINITKDDSSLMIDSNTGNIYGTLYGEHIGDVKGSVFADDSTVLVDGVAGVLRGSFVGTVNSVTGNIENINGATIVLSGYDSFGNRAGLRIDTDGDFNDNYDLFTIRAASPNADGQLIQFARSRGTLSSPTALQNGDNLPAILWSGTDSTDSFVPIAALNVSVDGAPAPGYVPGKIAFSLWDNLGNVDNVLSIGTDLVLNVGDATVPAGAGSGEVNVGGGIVSYLKIKVGSTYYALPMYGLNP